MDCPTWYETFDLGRWKYRLTEPQSFHGIARHPAGTVHIIGATPKRPHLATLHHSGILTIHPGYAWDGATSAPDLTKLQRAVVLHDLLCQCCESPDWHLTRFQCDRLFYREARQSAPILAPFYYAGIRIGGQLHRAMNPPGDWQSVTICPV